MNTLLNYPGAKWGMAEEIVSLMPPHRSYLEPFFGSGAMKYGCENCGLTWWMFLEKGLEEFGENHKPVPFTIRCPVCGGFARDISGICKFPDGGYRELPQGEAYFANVEGQDCGVPMTDMITKMFRG